MLHLYKDPITGKVYQQYDDEPEDNDDDLQEEESEEHDYDSEVEYLEDKFEKEYERYLNWLYK
jgi:hypothetical protein